MREWIIAVSVFVYAGAAWAHGGGLNADGCHHDRKNGGYHCHRGPSAPRVPNSDHAPRAPSPYAQGLQAQGTGARGGDAGSPHFRNCSHARAAGAAPVRRGDPGYGPHLDRDGDGVGCE